MFTRYIKDAGSRHRDFELAAPQHRTDTALSSTAGSVGDRPEREADPVRAQRKVRTLWPSIIVALIAMSLLVQCGGATPTPRPSPAKELILYDWPGYMP